MNVKSLDLRTFPVYFIKSSMKILHYSRDSALMSNQHNQDNDSKQSVQRSLSHTHTHTRTTHTHTHTHTINGPFSRTTRVGRYQKRKTNLDFTEARDSELQWHQLGHMQVCTSLQASTPPLSFLQAGCPSCHPTNSVKALKAAALMIKQNIKTVRHQSAQRTGSGWVLFCCSSFMMRSFLARASVSCCTCSCSYNEWLYFQTKVLDQSLIQT